MRKHKEVIQAWLDGKDIQYKIDINGIWKTFSDSTTINPMTYEYPEWRIKPTKTVDYQTLIDAKMLVGFTDADGHFTGHSVISRLTQIDCHNTYVDDSGASWDVIMFEEGLMQVVTQDTAMDLYNAGFEFDTLFSNYTDYHDEVFHTIILKGVEDGYTL